MYVCNIKDKIRIKIQKINKLIVFHPISIVLIGYTAIFILAIPYLGNLGFINLMRVLVITITFILAYSIPFILPTKKFFKINHNFNKLILFLSFLFLVLLSAFGSFEITHSIILSIIYSLFTFLMADLFVKLYDKKIFINLLFAIGIISFLLIVIIYGGVPLFNYSIRMAINSDPLRLIAMGSLIYSGIENTYYFVISFIILSLLGYKAGILILFFSYIIYRYQNISLKKLILAVFLLIVVLGVLGKIILLSSNQNWKMNPIELLCYRSYFDLYVFNKIIENNIITYGKIILTPNGERLVGKILFGYFHNITTTLFGTVYLDFGIFGIFFAMLLGAISKYIYEGDKKLYAVYASILLAYCEIGINYGFLVVLSILLYINSKLKYSKYLKRDY